MAFPISWVDLTSDSDPRSVPLEQRGGDVYLLVHHAVNRVVQDSIAISKPGGRATSMNLAMGPTSPGVTSPIYCVLVVSFDRRAWTTASSIDDRGITVEVSNIDITASYPVAMEAKELLARTAAEMHKVYGMPLDRTHVLSHQEVYARGLGSYATACPGPDLQSAMDWIVARAKQITSGGDMALKLIALSPSKDGLVVAGWHYVLENGHIRPLTSLENDYAFSASNPPTFSWQGEDIRTLGSLVGFMEYETLPAGVKVTTGATVKGPGRITGRLIYADRSKPVDPAGGWTPTAADLAEIGRNVPAVNLTALETLIKGIPTAVDAALSDEQTQLVNLINGLPAAIRAKIIAP